MLDQLEDILRRIKELEDKVGGCPCEEPQKDGLPPRDQEADRGRERRGGACGHWHVVMKDDATAVALRRIIEPIVRGQLRSFILAHPEAGLSRDWIKSIEKRITNDLLSRGQSLRLGAVLCGSNCARPRAGGLAGCSEPPTLGVADTVPGVPPNGLTNPLVAKLVDAEGLNPACPKRIETLEKEKAEIEKKMTQARERIDAFTAAKRQH